MSFIQTFVNRSNTVIYVPNQFIPLMCVFIIAKTPAILLVGFVLGYMMTQPMETKQTHHTIDEPVNTIDNSHNDSPVEEKESAIDLSIEKNGLSDPGNSLLEDSTFENLLQFPSCPTTLPSTDPSEIDWTAINQEMEYDQQRLHYFPQENLPILFSQKQLQQQLQQQQQKEEERNFSYIYSDMLLQEKINDNTLAFPTITTDAAILVVDNEEDMMRESSLSLSIEDLLLLPLPPNKPTLSSPGQLFKSKFQKAVKKMKKSTHLKQDDMDKRASILSGSSTKRAASLQLNSYFSQDPLFVPLSPRPSASARVHDHFKGRLNKLFKK